MPVSIIRAQLMRVWRPQTVNIEQKIRFAAGEFSMQINRSHVTINHSCSFLYSVNVQFNSISHIDGNTFHFSHEYNLADKIANTVQPNKKIYKHVRQHFRVKRPAKTNITLLTNAAVTFARLWSSCTNRIVMHLRQLSVLCLIFTLLYSCPSVCLSVFFMFVCFLPRDAL